jgi:hypothetical protein
MRARFVIFFNVIFHIYQFHVMNALGSCLRMFDHQGSIKFVMHRIHTSYRKERRSLKIRSKKKKIVVTIHIHHDASRGV